MRRKHRLITKAQLAGGKNSCAIPVPFQQNGQIRDNSQILAPSDDSGPLGFSKEKDLAGPEARLTLVERFPAEQRGCVAPRSEM